MTTEAMSPAATINRIEDYDAITKVVQLYIDGAGSADVGELKEAFHENAWMFGNVFGHRYDMAIGDFFAFVASEPAPGSDYGARIVGIGPCSTPAWPRSSKRTTSAWISWTSSHSPRSTAGGRS